ncbi:MAG: DUF2934 domain-containing protein [Verrucomicrobiia bacterium]
MKRTKKTRPPANAAKQQRIHRRAGELANIHGRPPDQPAQEDWTEAERELLGLQTMADPDKPSTAHRTKAERRQK